MISINSFFNFFKYAGHVESEFGKNLRKKCFDRVQQLSFPYFDRTANGWIMARISSDCTRIADTLAWSFVDLFWGIFLIIELTIVMLIIDWKMALAVLVIVPILFFISLYFQKKILRAQRATRKANSLVTAGFSESINGAKTTKTLGVEYVPPKSLGSFFQVIRKRFIGEKSCIPVFLNWARISSGTLFGSFNWAIVGRTILFSLAFL